MVRRHHSLLTLCCCCFLLLSVVVAHAASPNEGDVEVAEEMPNFAKMRVKALRRYLSERGMECVGCVEKSEFVALAQEAFSKPVVEAAPEPEASPKPSAGGSKPGSPPPDIDIDAIMKKMEEDRKQKDQMRETLRKAGIDTSGMNFGGMGDIDPSILENLRRSRGPPPPRKQKRRKKRPKRDEPEVDEEIEL